jgi:uncharacterized membrane protein YfcA
MMEAAWLKQHAWCLNLVVAAIAFYHYHKAGYHVPKLTLPFVLMSVPLAAIGGYVRIDGAIYDMLLSMTLIWAAYRLITIRNEIDDVETVVPELKVAVPVGGGIGLMSGVVGVGGGIFLSPVILLNKWASPKVVAATSALFIWVNSAAGLCGAALSGQLNLDVSVLLPFAVVVLIGGFLGSRYGATAPQQIIRKILVVVLIIAAARRVMALFGI